MLQYVALFIVILAVMAAMNGFLFLMLRGLSRQLKEQVNSCFLRQLEFTDAIYEEKREKLNRLKEEENTFLGRASASPVKEQLDGPKETTVKTAAPVTVAVPAAVESDRQAGYINPSLIEDYRYIKEHFKVDTEEAYQSRIRNGFITEMSAVICMKSWILILYTGSVFWQYRISMRFSMKSLMMMKMRC